MRSNRTGRTTDNRLFRWNGRFFFAFFKGCFNGVKLKLLRRLLYGRQNSKKERQCLASCHGFASFKIVCIFIISDVSAKARGKTQIAAKSLSQGSFLLHILLPCRRLPGRGQELLHVPAHGGVVLLLPPRLLTLGGQRFKAFHALRSPPETRAPASNFDCSGKGAEQRKIRKRVLACCAC